MVGAILICGAILRLPDNMDRTKYISVYNLINAGRIQKFLYAEKHANEVAKPNLSKIWLFRQILNLRENESRNILIFSLQEFWCYVLHSE